MDNYVDVGNLDGDENVAFNLLDALNSLLDKSKNPFYREGVQDSIDIVNLTLSGKHPYPYLKKS